MRIGIGYDVHRLVENRKLIIGGVDIPFEKGLLGHSDADVLIHAIMDALLGACGERDIGVHFPPEDNNLKDISSKILLSRVNEIIKKRGFKIGNIDSIIVAEKPKLSPHIEEMKKQLSAVLNIGIDQINIKATTTETLGFEGRLEGISAQAVALLNEI